MNLLDPNPYHLIDTDEVTTSKPNGRVVMDRGRGDRKPNLLKCKQLFTASTLKHKNI